MRCSSISIDPVRRSGPWLPIIAAVTLLASPAAAQGVRPDWTALSHLPYWLPVPSGVPAEVVPLAWFNEVDGPVVGTGARHQLELGTIWWGVGFGLRGDGGAPAAIEAGARIGDADLGFRTLHGRNAFSVFHVVPLAGPRLRLRIGASAVWISDDRYIETVPLFRCPAAPVVPCDSGPEPYGWSPGRDHALEARVAWAGPGRSGRLEGALIGGLEVAGGDHEYLGVRLAWSRDGRLGPGDWRLRVAGGWVSGRAPQQRRFFLHGAGPIRRWLNPMLEARDAILTDVPYFVEGGAHLRAYDDTRPLVKRYMGTAVEYGRTVAVRHGVWGRVAGFAEIAWTPGIPDRLGPEQLGPDGPILFDWRELPVGEGGPLGRFRARVLEVDEVWADAGAALTIGYRRLAARVSLPLLASAPAFAGDPLLREDKRTLALRWSLTVRLSAPAPPTP